MPLTHLRGRSKVILGAAALVAATVGAGAYAYVNYVSVDRYTSDHGQVTVESNPVDGHGPVLVTDKGFALYMFPPDGASRVSCTGDCAFAWPRLLVPDASVRGNCQQLRPVLVSSPAITSHYPES